ncbi:MAG: hypothetical protein AAF672_09495 [Pseudomonadota bacterium]
MPKLATRSAPRCLTQAPLPQALAEYDASANLSDIGAAFEPLALAGTLFDDALITTQNAGALISCGGGYGALQRSDMPLRLTRSERRADMRFASEQTVNLTRVEQDGRVSVVALDRHGQIQHRVQLGVHDDIAVAQSLEVQPHQARAATEGFASNFIPLDAIRCARQGWRGADVGQHLNAFLVNGGTLRHRTLRHIGKYKAWEIGLCILPSFVTFLSDKAVSAARVVIGDGLMQLDVGALSGVETHDDVVIAGSETRRFALDFKQIASAWVTSMNRCSQLELYDANGCALAIIGSDPYERDGVFADMLLALPAKRMRQR